MSDPPKLTAVPRHHRKPLTEAEREENHRVSVDKIVEFLGGLRKKKYFGKVTLSIENGTITSLRTEQVIKIDDEL